ncbi:MAG: LicD family protein [Agathobacter sp.]|nr:LicD family protein [Agathobacter sp.]
MAVLETNELFKERLSRKQGMHQLLPEETERVKQIVLEITVDIVSLCEELSVPYMLGGGSALGAVRHQGFIPWDDDIDLNIPRADIDRLLDAVEERYPEKYYVEAPLRTPGYLSSFIQIHRRGTVFQEYLAQKKEDCGIKIDIFVIENTFDQIILRKLHGLLVQAGLFFLSCYRMFAWRKEFKHLSKGDAKAALVMKIKGIMGLPFAVAPHFFYWCVQKSMMCCKDDNSRYVTIPSGRKHFFGELYQRKSFMDTQSMVFQGHLFQVSKEYDHYLSNLYGDYMTLPPEEHREHHVIYDLKFQGEYHPPMLLNKKQVQKLLLSMLEDFASYCRKHGLRYYLVGGTLLGAVRHKGFIPWDDDIDVGMPRPDYERFLELTRTEPVAPYLQAISGEEYTLSNPYCELIHMQTRLERSSSRYIRQKCQNLHLFIDIFPQDGWPENDREAERLAAKMKKMRYMIQNARAKIGKGTSPLRILAKTPAVLTMRLVGWQRVINCMNRIAKTYDYDSSRYVGAVTYGIYGPGERCLHDEVVDFTEVTFEGKRYPAPGCYDRYLTQIFGDYMQLPPEDKRVDHKMKVWYEGEALGW